MGSVTRTRSTGDLVAPTGLVPECPSRSALTPPRPCGGMSARECRVNPKYSEPIYMTFATRIDLTVPYAEKEEAKALGARWDGDKRSGTHRRAPTSGTSTNAGSPRDVAPRDRRVGTVRPRTGRRAREGRLPHRPAGPGQGRHRPGPARCRLGPGRGQRTAGQERPPLPDPGRAERAGRRARPVQGGHLEEPGRRRSRRSSSRRPARASGPTSRSSAWQGPVRPALRPRPDHRGRGPGRYFIPSLPWLVAVGVAIATAPFGYRRFS